ncbi:MAG: alkaline phosphatase family protein [Actinomycetota bacterium]
MRRHLPVRIAVPRTSGRRTQVWIRLWMVVPLLLAACIGPDQGGRPSGVEPDDASPPRLSGRRWFRQACKLPPRYLTLIERGHHEGRSPELVVVPRKPNLFGSFEVTTHSGPWNYLQRVPLVFYGPPFVRSQGRPVAKREVTLADIAPTLAEVLGLEWPEDRPGRALTDAVAASGDGARPRLIVVVVWDGGGWNVLREWPGSWPRLRELMRKGYSVPNATVGSSPSVTPAAHATIGTGAWPEQHGVVDLSFRDEGEVVGTFAEEHPDDLKLPTIADLWDRATGNEAEVAFLAERNWHLGMLGHGAFTRGGDRDIAAFGEAAGGDLYTNEEWYSLPSYLQDVPGLSGDVRTIDLEDGRVDSTWLGHPLGEDSYRESPVQALYQTRQLEALISQEGLGDDDVTDLLFVNYKQVDLLGHIYNMVTPEMRSILSWTDRSLAELIDHLNAEVGRRRWMVVLTADHGQGPDPRTTGGWPIDIEELSDDAGAAFGLSRDELFDRTRITGFWINPEATKDKGITLDQVANFLIEYRLKDNADAYSGMTNRYAQRKNEPLLAAAFPSESLDEVQECAEHRRDRD